MIRLWVAGLVFALIVLLAPGCSAYGSIRYQGSPDSSSADIRGWNVTLLGVSYGGRPGSQYWGDQYVYVHLRAENRTDRYSVMHFGGSQRTEKDYRISKHVTQPFIGRLERKDPERVDKAGFLAPFPSVALRLRHSGQPSSWAGHESFRGAAASALRDNGRSADSVPPNEMYALPMGYQRPAFETEFCDGGIHTPWLKPGTAIICRKKFSVPDGTVPVAVEIGTVTLPVGGETR